jgi:hypothetical protein
MLNKKMFVATENTESIEKKLYFSVCSVAHLICHLSDYNANVPVKSENRGRRPRLS